MDKSKRELDNLVDETFESRIDETFELSSRVQVSISVMLLLPVTDSSAANMVFSKVRSWSDEREKNNNNTVRNDILRTPSRCTFVYQTVFDFISPPFCLGTLLASAICKYASHHLISMKFILVLLCLHPPFISI